jgi:hypothetical protein
MRAKNVCNHYDAGATPARKALHMRIESTSDVSLMGLREATQSLPADWHAEVDDKQLFFKSMEVPSWVSIVAAAPWWVQALTAAASVYVSAIISEAGKDTWKNRHRIAAGIRRIPSAITQLAEFILSARSAGTEKTFVMLSIPFPDEYSTTHLRVSHSSREELEFSIALFVHHIPELTRLLQGEGLVENPPVGGIQLELDDDCSLLVTWMDRKSLDQCDRVIPFVAGS